MRRVSLVTFLFAFLLTSIRMGAGTKSNPKGTVPAVTEGDIIFLGGYSYYIVRDAQVTVYKIARMGYTSVRDFQRTVGLDDDGIVGPDTRAKASEEYIKCFSSEPAISGTAANLLLSAQGKVMKEAPVLKIEIKNTGSKPVKIVGGLYCNEKRGFIFGDAYVIVVESISTLRGGILACGERTQTGKVPCGTVIRAGQKYLVEVMLPVLKDNEDGAISVQFGYMDWRLRDIFVSTGVLKYPKASKIARR
jgi:hypothetical protein